MGAYIGALHSWKLIHGEGPFDSHCRSADVTGVATRVSHVSLISYECLKNGNSQAGSLLWSLMTITLDNLPCYCPARTMSCDFASISIFRNQQ